MPEGVEAETEVWLGSSTSMDGGEFLEVMQTIKEFQHAISELQEEFGSLTIGLDRQDAEDLLYGKKSTFTRTQVTAAFEVMDAIIEEDPENIAPRLMADQTSELTISEAAEVWDELVGLAQKYGQDPDQDSDQ